MTYYLTEYGGKGFTPWEDLELVIDDLKIWIRDKDYPDTVKTDTCVLDIYVDKSTQDGDDFTNKETGHKLVKTWEVPTKKNDTTIDGLSFIWCPIAAKEGGGSEAGNTLDPPVAK